MWASFVAGVSPFNTSGSRNLSQDLEFRVWNGRIAGSGVTSQALVAGSACGPQIGQFEEIYVIRVGTHPGTREKRSLHSWGDVQAGFGASAAREFHTCVDAY